MSDPLSEIVSMSNDDSITREDITDDENDNEAADDTSDEGEGDDETDDKHDDNDGTTKKKKGKKEKKFSTESTPKKKQKINKKKLSHDLQSNKLRQIKVSLPYSVKSERVVDYNKSEEVIPEKKTVQESKQSITEKKWFKVVSLILVTIFCSLLIMFVTIKMYRHIERKAHEQNILATNDVKRDVKHDDDNEYKEPNYDKMFNDLGKGIKGGKTNSSSSSSSSSTKKSSSSSSSMPPRDSKGRFMSRKTK